MATEKIRQGYIIKNHNNRYCKGILNTYKKGNHCFQYYLEDARIFYSKSDVFSFISNVLGSKGAAHYKEISIVKFAIIELIDEKITDIINIDTHTTIREEINSLDSYYFRDMASQYSKSFPKVKDDQASTQIT